VKTHLTHATERDLQYSFKLIS